MKCIVHNREQQQHTTRPSGAPFRRASITHKLLNQSVQPAAAKCALRTLKLPRSGGEALS